jgi:hypothetical protein
MFAFAPTIMKGITNLRTDTVTVVSSITTAEGTTGDITLSRELFDDNLTNIQSVTSSPAYSDVPIASNYDSNTGDLTISGLEAGETRNVTVIYLAQKNDVFWGAVGPFLAFLVFGGILAAIAYSVWKPSRR